VALASVYHRGLRGGHRGQRGPELVSLALAEAGLAGRSTGVVLRPRVEVALERNAAEGRKSFDTTVLEPAIRRIDADLAGQATGRLDRHRQQRRASRRHRGTDPAELGPLSGSASGPPASRA
jgi:hypothetical protein